MFGMWETVYAYLSRMVGNRTDPADTNGSLHAKTSDLKYQVAIGGVVLKEVVPSNNLKLSSDAERSTSETESYVIAKKVVVHKAGVYRISYDTRRSGSWSNNSVIFRNGEEYSPAYFGSSETYTTVTEDLYFSPGDVIELGHKASQASYPSYVRNFRIYFDDAPASNGYVLE